jgi:transposase
MMTLQYGCASFVRCEADGLTLHLSARLFGVDRWRTITAWFQTPVRDAHWLSAPFRVMTAEEAVPGYPRWKQVGIDVFSWILFHLMVPPDHVLVKLWQTTPWKDINRLVASKYRNAKSGQRAWAPAQMMALLVLFFVLPAPSECALLRLVAIVPLYRWFCGFGVFSPLPDHSTLHTFRKHIGAACFEAILTWIVARCLELGLIANELLYFDMTDVAAAAHAWTPYERAVLLTHALVRYLEQKEKGSAAERPVPEALRQLAAEIALEVLENKRLSQDPKAPHRVLKSLARWRQHGQERKGKAHWEVTVEEVVQALVAEEHGGPSLASEDPSHWLKELARRLKKLLPQARGDVEARVNRVSGVRLVCGYWLGFLVDSLHNVITAVRVVPLDVVQRTQMLPALEQHRERVGAYPAAVTADSAQDYFSVHQGLDNHQIEGHIASRTYNQPTSGLGPEHFTWDQHGQLHCPEGGAMTAGTPRKRGEVPFTASGCASCPRKEECLPKKQQPEGPRRILLKPLPHQRWHQNRAHTRTPAYKVAQSKRFASEGLFGLAKRLHRSGKMPYRSLAMNQIAGLMIAIVMDLSLLAQRDEAATTYL